MPSTRSARFPRSLAVLIAAIGCIGAAFSFAVYRYSLRAQRSHLEAEFVRRAEIRHALSRELLNHYVSAVYALKGLFQGSARVSREEFRTVASEIIGRYPGITALEWVPIVPAGERAALEAAVSAELGRAWQFTERGATPDAPLVRARERAEHFPILYVEPLAGNERAFGYDVKTAVTGPFIERVRYSGELAVTTQFQLVQSRRGIVLVYPIFARATNGASEKRCTGVVQVVFRVDEMLAQSELRSPSDSTETLFVDDTAAEPEDRLLHYDARDASPGHEFPVSEAAFRSGLTREFAMEFGGRRWLALYRPSKRWIEEQRTWYPELWLASGLSITALIAGLVFVLARRAAAIERLVADRTAELEESRRQLDSLLHSLPGMAFRSRFDDTVTLLFVSEGALPLTGRPASDFIQGAVHFRDVIHPEDLPRVRAATQAALHNRAEFEFEYRIRTFDGREKWVLTRGHGVYSADGTAEFFEGLAIDVTARKQAELEKLALERKLLESQKLESLGLLAGGIAHDFNNLLTGIMGNASLARHRPDVTSEIADHLRKIEAGAARAAELCQQMLAYSGRGRFLVENVELGQLVRDTLPLLRGSLSPRARLELALSEEPTVVTGDATQLRQIVMNLILNAGEALGGAGGEIVVATGRHWIDREFLAAARVGDSLPPGEYVTLEVRDNGCGMSADTLTKIFDPFFTTKFTGRGLGLAAVLGIVRGHSGALKVRSAVGLGTTFTLVLPPGASAPVARRTAESSTPWRAKGKVLIVDDEAPVREVAAQLVATFGFTVVTAADGPAALAEFGRDPAGFDLVFLDLTMPGMDGEETLAVLRAIHPAVRVLLVSGYSENERIAELASRGPLGFLQKPFTRARLEKKIREILG